MCEPDWPFRRVVTYKADMDRGSFHHWLASYGSAWTARDPEAAASLYGRRCHLSSHALRRTLRGRAAIYEYWAGVAKTEEKIRFDFKILADTAEHGIAKWWASFVRVPPGLETKLDGIFLISLDSGGRYGSGGINGGKASASVRARSGVDGPTALLVSQRLCWRNPGRPSRRQVGRQHGDQKQRGDDDDINQNVHAAGIEEHGVHELLQRKAQH